MHREGAQDSRDGDDHADVDEHGPFLRRQDPVPSRTGVRRARNKWSLLSKNGAGKAHSFQIRSPTQKAAGPLSSSQLSVVIADPGLKLSPRQVRRYLDAMGGTLAADQEQSPPSPASR